MDLITPDFGLFFWMLITFTLVFLILKKYAWRPIVQALREREENIQEGIDNAEKARIEIENVRIKSDKIISESIVERDKLIRQGRDIKEKIIADARKEADAETRRMMETAKRLIEEEKIAAVNQIKVQIASLSVEIAERILRKRLKEDADQKELMNSLLEEFKLN
jgi:F-type H+-transporting ATPase subunit b